MANYCEGILRVRGSYENLKRFIDETFDGVQLLEEKISGYEDMRNARRLEFMKMRMYAKANYEGMELELLFDEIDEEEKASGECPGAILHFQYDEKQNEFGYAMNDSCNYGRAAFAEFSQASFSHSMLYPSKHVIYFKMYQGWVIEGDYIVMLARKYDLDMAIDSYEKGVGHEGHVKIVKGQIIMNWWTESHEDWDFDVPMPSAGF